MPEKDVVRGRTRSVLGLLEPSDDLPKLDFRRGIRMQPTYIYGSLAVWSFSSKYTSVLELG